MKNVKFFTLTLTLLLGVCISPIVSAKPSETIIYQAEIKSENELLKDAKAGKRDQGLKVNLFTSELDENNKVSLKNNNNNVKTYYTVQKLKETKKGEAIKRNYVVYAVTDYTKKDSGENDGMNFTQRIWGWFETTSYGVDEYSNGYRYETKWELHDSNRLTISEAAMIARTEGSNLNEKLVIKSSPSTYSPLAWGRTYAKSTKWDQIRVTDGIGFTGAAQKTRYKAGSSTGTIYSGVTVGAALLPQDFWPR